MHVTFLLGNQLQIKQGQETPLHVENQQTWNKVLKENNTAQLWF